MAPPAYPEAISVLLRPQQLVYRSIVHTLTTSCLNPLAAELSKLVTKRARFLGVITAIKFRYHFKLGVVECRLPVELR